MDQVDCPTSPHESGHLRDLRTTAPSQPNALREALDDRNNVFALESEPPSLSQQFLSLCPDDAALGFARNSHTAASAELEHAFVSEGAKCPQHRVGVDTQDRCHVVGGRQALTGTNIAAGDVMTDLCGDLFMQGHGVVSVNLDMTHGDNHSVTIVPSTRTYPKEAPAPDLVDYELVIREARRRQRRRWLVIAVVIVTAACSVAAIVGLSGRGATPKHPAVRPARTHNVTPVGPTTTGVVPQRPSSLAIGPNKNLYIADDMRNQVLERLPDGSFVPVAGSGTVGFSGDGGPATSAQLNYPSGIVFGPDGTLYIADYGNGRIRAVSSAGIITTIAGNGGQGAWVADGTPALVASLRPTAMAFGPEALMYVADDREVLRLEPNGSGAPFWRGAFFTRVLGENANEYAGLYGIGGPARSASADGANGVAIDSSGNTYVSGSNTKAILMIDTQGIVHFLGDLYPRGPSGLVEAPDGSVVAMDELAVVGLSPQGIKTLLSFPTTDKVGYLGITGFSPNGIAIGPEGTLYLDTFSGNGFADKSALIMIPSQGDGSPSLLWEQRSS
jgi:NHL repeat